MNRDEAIKICVDRLDRWPTRSHDLSLLPFCPDWAWTRINNDVVLDAYSIQPSIKESDWNAARLEIVEDQSIENSSGDINDEDINTDPPPSKYHVRNIWQGEEWLDFYTVWDAIKLGKNYQVGDSAIEHAMKKGFAIGERSGGKSRVQDLKEMIWSLERAVELIEARG